MNRILGDSRAERLYEHLMPSGRYLFIPFLRAKSPMDPTKNRSRENSHKKIFYKISATNLV